MPPFPAAGRPAVASSLSIAASRASLLSAASRPFSLPSASAACLRSASIPSVFSLSRSFSSTLPRLTKTVKAHLLPDRLIPPYPYGERQVYKQSNRGLYANARIRFGHNVSKKHAVKTRRFWRPNVHVKCFYLPSLGANIKTRLTLRVLKTIRREGGIENYLLKSKPARIKELGPGGWNMRWLLMQSRDVQRRFNDERVALGLEPREIEDRDDIIQYALDFATPGPLSMRSRATLDELKNAAELDALFTLGDEALADLEGIQELSDEEEAQLLKDLDAAEAQSKREDPITV